MKVSIESLEDILTLAGESEFPLISLGNGIFAFLDSIGSIELEISPLLAVHTDSELTEEQLSLLLSLFAEVLPFEGSLTGMEPITHVTDHLMEDLLREVEPRITVLGCGSSGRNIAAAKGTGLLQILDCVSALTHDLNQYPLIDFCRFYTISDIVMVKIRFENKFQPTAKPICASALRTNNTAAKHSCNRPTGFRLPRSNRARK